MAVRIRMKKMGRTHRPFFRICAMDKRAPRDGRVLEELGTYDPSVPDTDARALLNRERIDYWLSVGAQPSEKVAVLIKKYGSRGTHTQAQQAALDKLAAPKAIPDPGPAVTLPKSAEAPEAPAPKAAAPEAAAPEEALEAAAPEAAAPEAAAPEAAAPEAEAASAEAAPAEPEQEK